MPYLLAAEADKIQEFIFRSSSLREVVGASQLLASFCEDQEKGAAELIRRHQGTVRVSGGGSFRVEFETEQQARECGAELAEMYRLLVDGRLSVAEPVLRQGNFQDVNQRADVELRRTKSHRSPTAEAHMPYIAFCASCGVGLAEQYDRLHREPENRRERYLCAACQAKAQARWDQRLPFLRRFLTRVVGSERNLHQFDWPDDADAVAIHDPSGRSYVAYLVADGNGMGAVFGQCDEQQITALSNGLTKAVETSLAEPTGVLMRHLEQRRNNQQQIIIPVLPLILGGDDLFTLIPAAYALDVAQRFCLAYEREVRALVQQLDYIPTIAAAVVICKSTYPYVLAHRRAEALLKVAKRQSKLLTAERGEHHSTIHFEVILGNRLTGLDRQDAAQRRIVQPSLRPYWVAPPSKETPQPLSEAAQERGIALDALLAQRLLLKDVPGKRLAELRRHFESLPEMAIMNRHDSLNAWIRTLRPTIDRSGYKTVIDAALAALGQPIPEQTHGEEQHIEHHWRFIERDRATPLAHGMLDLLEVWDFAQSLDHPLADYTSEEAD